MTNAIWHECYHEAGVYTDNCWGCAPYWRRIPCCPNCRGINGRYVRLRGKGTKLKRCPECRAMFRVDEADPQIIPHDHNALKGAPQE